MKHLKIVDDNKRVKRKFGVMIIMIGFLFATMGLINYQNINRNQLISETIHPLNFQGCWKCGGCMDGFVVWDIQNPETYAQLNSANCAYGLKNNILAMISMYCK
jgi:hypothetical protein